MLEEGAACRIENKSGTSSVAKIRGAKIQLKVPWTSQYVSHDQRLIPRKGK
jgi:hypothetical protein